MSIATYTENTAKLNGLDLHYLEWGPSNASPIVLLHGLTSHAHSWDTFASALAGERRLVALDQRGHGDSQWADTYTSADYVADALALVDSLELERFDLVGLSMGAHNSMAFTIAHPMRVRRLVPIDIPPALRRPEPGAAPTPGAPPLQAPQRVFDSVDEAFRGARQQNPRPPEDVHRNRVVWSLRERPDGKLEIKYDPQAPAKWRPDDLWDALPSIACPVLVIRGAESMVLSPENAEKMTAAFPDARLVTVEGAGHPVPLDRPADFEKVVREFLD